MKLELPSALRHLNNDPESPYRGVFLFAKERVAVATDGAAIAIVPLPEKFPLHADKQIDGSLISADACDVDKAPAPTEHLEWEAIPDACEAPVYRIAIDAAKLHTLAEALGETGNVVLEFGARADSPIRVMPFGKSGLGDPTGFIMAGSSGFPDGLLASGIQTPPAASPAQGITMHLNAERNSIELTFPGKPDETIREELKDHGFRWFGKGKLWYAKDTEARRKWTEELVGMLRQAA